MPESLYVNEDWSALVPAGSPEAAFGITPKDAKRRGLLRLEKGESLGEPEVLKSANLLPEPIEAEVEVEPEPESKQAPAPADKQAQQPANKAARRRRRK